jgi:hypothetical protein
MQQGIVRVIAAVLGLAASLVADAGYNTVPNGTISITKTPLWERK